MADEALQSILRLEQEMQEKLVRERRRAVAWVAEQQQALDRQTGRKSKEMHRQALLAGQEARAAAEAEAAALLAAAETGASRLDQLPGLFLERLVLRSLLGLLPEPRP